MYGRGSDRDTLDVVMHLKLQLSKSEAQYCWYLHVVLSVFAAIVLHSAKGVMLVVMLCRLVMLCTCTRGVP